MDADILFGAVKAIAVLPAIFWLIGQFGMPRRYWTDQRSQPDLDRMSALSRWRLYGGLIVVFGGVMFIAYEATDVVLDWMPRSWGGIDEDGEWRAMRPGVQGTIALFVAMFIMESAEKRAEAVAKRPIEYALLSAVIDGLEKKPWCFDGEEESAQDYRQRIAMRGRAALNGTEKYDDAYSLQEYRRRLMESLIDIERQIEATKK
ncbi:hypothetical protein [Brevundimonas sp.]|uniref:hypothetical protein n=1 Tax=Brevundimonas sp. TaxID=1871086 RepID=UPI0028A97BE9|nr:hypothetical protein [Brevundimonas sp.]